MNALNYFLPSNKDKDPSLVVLSAINFKIATNGTNRIIPAAPQRIPPAIMLMIVASELIFKRLLTAKGKMRFTSKYCTIENTAITPKGYQIELYVSQATEIGRREPIIIPTKGTKVRTEAIYPNRNG